MVKSFISSQKLIWTLYTNTTDCTLLVLPRIDYSCKYVLRKNSGLVNLLDRVISRDFYGWFRTRTHQLLLPIDRTYNFTYDFSWFMNTWTILFYHLLVYQLRSVKFYPALFIFLIILIFWLTNQWYLYFCSNFLKFYEQTTLFYFLNF